VVPKPEAPSELPIRDPGDRWILASAIDAKADVLITGDEDLLDIAVFAPLPVLAPRAFGISSAGPIETPRQAAELLCRLTTLALGQAGAWPGGGVSVPPVPAHILLSG
jgi:hypothetical protein